jgi:predicted lysophospholipase L1 biosynthesis ABC-type transport system permease subunit
MYAPRADVEGVFGQRGRETSLVLFVATMLAVLAASYAFSRISDRMIQGRATRLSRSILAHVDRRFHRSSRGVTISTRWRDELYVQRRLRHVSC